MARCIRSDTTARGGSTRIGSNDDMGLIGVWLVGAQGSLASTVVVGARAIARGLAGRAGLVTELPEVRALPLVEFDRLVFGGWDIAPQGLVARAEAMEREDRALPPGLVDALR